MNIAGPFIRRPIATTLLMAAFTLAGIAAYFYLPVAPLPQVDFPTIQVRRAAGRQRRNDGRSVAAPLERQFGQIAGVIADDLIKHARQHPGQHPIRAQQQHRFGSTGRPGGDHGRRQDAAEQMTPPPSYRKSIPPIRRSSFWRYRPIRCRSPQSTTMPTTSSRSRSPRSTVSPSRHRRRAASRDPGTGRPGEARLARSDAGGSARRARPHHRHAAKGTVNGDGISFTIAANDQIMKPGDYNNIILAYRQGGTDPRPRRRPSRSRPIRTTARQPGPASAASCWSSTSSPAPTSSKPSTASSDALPRLTANIPPASKCRRHAATAPSRSAPRSRTSSSRWP